MEIPESYIKDLIDRLRRIKAESERVEKELMSLLKPPETEETKPPTK